MSFSSVNKVMGTIFHFIRRVASSRLGQFLFVLHLVLAVYAVGSIAPADPKQWWADCAAIPLAGRSVKPFLGSPLIQILAWLDLPALLIDYILRIILYIVVGILHPLDMYSMSWVEAFVLFILASLQWLFIGFCFERTIKSIRLRKSARTR